MYRIAQFDNLSHSEVGTLINELQNAWPREYMQNKSGEKLGRYVSLLKHNASSEQREEGLLFLLSKYKELGMPSDSLAHHVVTLLLLDNNAEKYYNNDRYRKDVVVCIMLFADSTLPFDDTEIAILTKLTHELTGCTLMYGDNIVRGTAEAFMSPGWSELVLSDWTINTKTSTKLEQLLEAPIKQLAPNSMTYVDIPCDIG